MDINAIILTEDEIKLMNDLEDKVFTGEASEIEKNAYAHLMSKSYRTNSIFIELASKPAKTSEENIALVACFNSLTQEAKEKAARKADVELESTINGLSKSEKLTEIGAILLSACKAELNSRQIADHKRM